MLVIIWEFFKQQVGPLKSLSLIQAIVLLHDQKRPKKKNQSNNSDLQQFEHSWENIALAIKLAHEILGRTLPNLSGPSILLLLLIDEMVDKVCVNQQINRVDVRFTGEEIKKYTGWSGSKITLHLQPLKKQRYIQEEDEMYKLVYNEKGKKIERFLIDPIFLNFDLSKKNAKIFDLSKEIHDGTY